MMKIPAKKERTKNPDNNKGKNKQIIIGMSYVSTISEHLQRTFRSYGVTMYHKPINTLRSILVRPKDKTKHLKKTGVIYNIKCMNCDKEYIGETARPLGRRLEEHKKLATSAVCEHQITTGHRMDWDSVKILESDAVDFRRKVKEAINIRHHSPALNRDPGIDLPAVYNHLLSRDSSGHLAPELLSGTLGVPSTPVC